MTKFVSMFLGALLAVFLLVGGMVLSVLLMALGLIIRIIPILLVAGLAYWIFF